MSGPLKEGVSSASVCESVMHKALSVVSFSLVSVVAACSSNAYYYYTPGTESDGGANDGSNATNDATSHHDSDIRDASDLGVDAADGASRDSGTPATDAGSPWVGPACARTKPNSASFKFQPPKVAAACNDRDLKYVNAQLANGASFRTIQQNIFTASCSACIFSEIADATWGPIVFTAGTTGFKNFAGCEVATGKNLTCGENSARLDYCWRGVCDQCATQTELQECLRASSQDPNAPCKAEYQAADSSCGGLAPVTGCGTLQAAIQTMCGSGLP